MHISRRHGQEAAGRHLKVLRLTVFGRGLDHRLTLEGEEVVPRVTVKVPGDLAAVGLEADDGELDFSRGMDQSWVPPAWLCRYSRRRNQRDDIIGSCGVGQIPARGRECACRSEGDDSSCRQRRHVDSGLVR